MCRENFDRIITTAAFSRSNFGLSLMKVAPSHYFSRQVIVYLPDFRQFGFKNHPDREFNPTRTQKLCPVPSLL
jgi:hypothetical protein